jgi:hypothetical protein
MLVASADPPGYMAYFRSMWEAVLILGLVRFNMDSLNVITIFFVLSEQSTDWESSTKFIGTLRSEVSMGVGASRF